MNEEEIEKHVIEKFMRYVQYDTTSDFESKTIPSTYKQIEFLQVLQQELQEMEIQTILSPNGHLFAYLSENPQLAFFAHVDTSSDAPGSNIKPLLYDFE